MRVMSLKKKKEEASNPVKIAEEAVKEYEELAGDLSRANERFQTEFPDAAAELKKLDEFKELVQHQIDKAKILVKAAGQTIGPFTFMVKKTSPGYDPKEIAVVLSKMESQSLGETFKALVEAGLVTAVALDKEVVKVYFAHNPDMATLFEPAYDEGGKELPPAVSAPKL